MPAKILTAQVATGASPSSGAAAAANAEIVRRGDTFDFPLTPRTAELHGDGSFRTEGDPVDEAYTYKPPAAVTGARTGALQPPRKSFEGHRATQVFDKTVDFAAGADEVTHDVVLDMLAAVHAAGVPFEDKCAPVFVLLPATSTLLLWRDRSLLHMLLPTR